MLIIIYLFTYLLTSTCNYFSLPVIMTLVDPSKYQEHIKSNRGLLQPVDNKPDFTISGTPCYTPFLLHLVVKTCFAFNLHFANHCLEFVFVNLIQLLYLVPWKCSIISKSQIILFISLLNSDWILNLKGICKSDNNIKAHTFKIMISTVIVI